MTTEFWVQLPGAKYDRQLGWQCSALSVPGAHLAEFRLGDETIPLERVVSDSPNLRLVVPPVGQPQDAAAKVKLEKRLVTFDSAIAVALIGLIGTLGSPFIARKVPGLSQVYAEPFIFEAGGVRGKSGPSLTFPAAVQSADLDVTNGVGAIKDKDKRIDGNKVHVSVIPKPEEEGTAYNYTLVVKLKQ